MGPQLVEAAKSYILPGDTRKLEQKSFDDLHEALERLDELDEKLDPQKKRTLNGRDVVKAAVAGSMVSGALWWGMASVGVAFTLANSFAAPLVIAMGVVTAVGGIQLTSSNNKAKALKDYETEVVEPKLHIMRMLNDSGVLTKEQKAEYERLSGEVKILKEIQTQYTEDLNKARDDAARQNTTNEGLLTRIHHQVEEEKKFKLLEKKLQTSLQTKEEYQKRLREIEGRAGELTREAEINEKSQSQLKDQLADSKDDVTRIKELVDTIQQRDEELHRAKQEFGEAENKWSLSEASFKRQIEDAGTREKALSGKLEVLELAKTELKRELSQKDQDLTDFEQQVQAKDLVLEKDKSRLTELQHEKDQAEKAVKRIEEEKGELQKLYEELKTSSEALSHTHGELVTARDDLLQKVSSSDQTREKAEKQLEELQGEFDEAKKQFEEDRLTLERRHEQQLQDKENESTKLEKKMRQKLARFQIGSKLLLGAKKKVEEAKKEALAKIEEQKHKLEELRKDKTDLEKRLEKQKKTFIRHFGEPRRPEQGDVRIVGDTSTRFKLDFFDLQLVSDKTKEFDGVQIESGDMAGFNAKKILEKRLKNAQLKLQKVHEETRAEYDPKQDGMPDLSSRRNKMKAALEEYKQEILSSINEFKEKHGRQKARDAILKNLEDTLDVAKAGISRVKGEEQNFLESAQVVDDLMADHNQAVNEDKKTKELGEITSMAFQSATDPSQEVRDLTCARVVQTLVDKFKSSMPETLPPEDDIETLETMRIELEKKKKVLQQFRPENLPLNTGQSLSPRGKKFLEYTVTNCIAELDKKSRNQDVIPEELPEAPRNEGGMVLARRMLDNPKTRADVYSWFSSLDDRHAGIRKSSDSFEYYKATVSGLEMIRHDHGLVYMPTPFELLTVIKADLGEVDSKFTTESCRQHRESVKDSSGKWRREKLANQCDKFLEKEREGDRLRGQPRIATLLSTSLLNSLSPVSSINSNGQDEELTNHPHKDVLDCFAGTNGCSEVVTQWASKTEETAFYVIPVKVNPDGLMNTFFEGCNGQPALRVNRKTKEESLSVDHHNDPQPGPVVFKKTGQGWKVSLGGKNWWVDPSFLTQNPNFQVPFEWKSPNHGQFQRDWIPMRDAHGNTSILVLRKSPAMGDRYFMYEIGQGEKLIPRPIGTTNIERERTDAQLLYEAALSSHRDRNHPHDDSLGSIGSGDFHLPSLSAGTDMMASLKTQQINMLTSKIDEDVLRITRMSRHWARKADQKALQRVCEKIHNNAQAVRQLAPLKSAPLQQILETIEVPRNELREIVDKKRTKQKTIQTYSRPKFSLFSVGAGFDAASGKYFSELRRKSKNHDNPVIDAQQRQCKVYREGVFRELQVFKGCELYGEGLESEIEGSPAKVEAHFAKVVKQNTDHCLRMQQQVDQLRTRLVRKIREGHKLQSGTDQYTDQQLLDRAAMEFEKGNIVHGLYDRGETKNIQLFVRWMQAENDLRLHNRMKRRLTVLNEQLLDIKKDAVVQTGEDPGQYRTRCQNWNLEMALVASEMQALQGRLDSYKTRKLDAATRVIMAFERRAETVLRAPGIGSDQVSEVERAIEDITLAMDSDKNMARVSQLGTGWGKSTMVQLWTDLACSLNVDHPKRSVLVIAPTRNKLDLDQMLVRYYDQKGLKYRSLDLMADYVNPAAMRHGKKWWKDPALTQIHNLLLGLPRDTPEKGRAELVQQVRAPVGASIQDVQILVHLRRKLQNESALEPALAPEDQIALRQLDGIIDLFRESMLFADEWDSALVPPLPHELDEVKDNVNKALRPLGGDKKFEIERKDVIHGHGAFIFGCKRKHLLSATTGTVYTAAVASGATKVDEVAQKCNTDPYTTSARVWHLLEMAEPILIDSRQGRLKKQVYEKVVERVGVDRPVMLFNSHARGGDNFEQAAENFNCLSEARQKAAGKNGDAGAGTKGMLYYDKSKKLCQYLPGDEKYDGQGGKNKDVPLTREDEELIRANGGNMVDVCLGQSESVGTDAPQCLESAGVFVGLFEQKHNGRFDLSAQQMGRLTRATRSMRKPQQFFMVVDCKAIEELDKTAERDQYLACYKDLEKKKKAFADKFESGKMSSDVKKAVAAPINVKPAVKDQTESIDDNLQYNLEAELNALEQTQWVKLQLTPDQMQAMRELKTTQWEAKVKYLELTAKELADRDVNEHIRSCEQTLEQAAVDSAMDRAYSEEDIWLKNLTCEGKLLDPESYRFNSGVSIKVPADPKTDMPNPPSRHTEKLVRDAMIAEASEKLAGLPRRTVNVVVDKEGLVAGYDPSIARARIRSVFEDIRNNGLGFRMGPVNKVHAQLRDYSLGALEDARTRIKAILDATKRDGMKIAGTGRIHNAGMLEPLLDKIKKQIQEVKNNNSFQHAMETEQFLETVYSRLLMSINYLVISSQDVATTTQLIRDQLKDLVGSDYKIETPKIAGKVLRNIIPECMSVLKGYVPPEGWKNSEARGPAVYCLKWIPKGRGSKVPKTRMVQVLKESDKQSVKAKGKGQANELKEIEITASPAFDRDFQWACSDESGRPLASGNFEQLKSFCEKGRGVSHILKCWEAAKTFCKPDSKDFDACVTDVERTVLDEYEELHETVKRDLHESSQNIQAQHQLMAAAAGTA